MSVKRKKDTSELRKDPVKGEWVIIATARGKRPHAFSGLPATIKQPKSTCPFEDPFSERDPVMVLIKDEAKDPKKDWSLVVLPNKFPALMEGNNIKETKNGVYEKMTGVGFHEVIILRDHDKFIPDLSENDVFDLIFAYRERLKEIYKNKIVKYAMILHNHGKEAGASLRHLHSQIIAVPVIPINIQRSLDGSKKFFKKHKKCVHCQMIKDDLKKKDRVVLQNKEFIAIVPFASRIAFELRIFPKNHQSDFRDLKNEDIKFFADILQKSLLKLRLCLNDPAFNFFIHTVPSFGKHDYYHWHLEILPKTSVWAGYELGSGMEVSAVLPEEAAKFLRQIKLSK